MYDFVKSCTWDMPKSSGTDASVMSQLSDLYIAIEMNQKKADVQAKLALADKAVAESFQVKAQTILWGLNEIRLALNFAQIDSTKESDGAENKVPLKGIFSSETIQIDGRETDQQSELRIRYIKLLDVYLRYVKQIDPELQNK